MSLTITTLVIAVAAFIIGLIIGAGLLQFAGKSQRKSRELEKDIQNKESEISEYRDEVQQHFNQTSELLNQLAHNYREIHNHLANGAENLCEKEPHQPIIKPLPELLEQADNKAETAKLNDSTEQPLDYAPKKSADEKGALSEDFGLEKVSVDNAEAQNPSSETNNA